MNNMQINILLIFFAAGIIISLLFDFFRILRKSFKTPNLIICFQDLLFWILSGFFIIWIAYKYTNGQIRAYMIISLFLAGILYFLIVSKPIVKFFSGIIINIKNLIFHFFTKFFHFFCKK